MRATACPVCEKPIPAAALDDVRPFSCPHCSELLRAIRRPGFIGGWFVHAYLSLLALTYGFGFTKELTFAVGAGLIIGLLNVVLNRLMGFELEPVGRIPLGGLED